jgi:hypothetical protein
MDEPLRFSNEFKLRRQMRKRRWTEAQIREALATTPIAAVGKKGPALRFRHPTSRKSVIVDAATGEIFHLGKEGFRYG